MMFTIPFFERYTSTDPEMDALLKAQYNKGRKDGAIIVLIAGLSGAVIGRTLRYYVKKN